METRRVQKVPTLDKLIDKITMIEEITGISNIYDNKPEVDENKLNLTYKDAVREICSATPEDVSENPKFYMYLLRLIRKISKERLSLIGQEINFGDR